MSDGGKGSARRPKAVTDLEYATRWDAIFGRDQAPEPRQHDFWHDGWGTWACRVCGRPEKYASYGETCPGVVK